MAAHDGAVRFSFVSIWNWYRRRRECVSDITLVLSMVSGELWTAGRNKAVWNGSQHWRQWSCGNLRPPLALLLCWVVNDTPWSCEWRRQRRGGDVSKHWRVALRVFKMLWVVVAFCNIIFRSRCLKNTPKWAWWCIVGNVMTFSFQKKKRVRRPSIAVQSPDPGSAPPITRENNRVRSSAVWMDRDDMKNARRFKNYLKYAPKIVLPLTLRGLRKPLTKDGRDKLEEKMDKLLSPSQPARCTSTQYVDRNGEPLLYYFGRRLVHPGDKQVSWYQLFALSLSYEIHVFVRTSTSGSRISTKAKRWKI